MTMVASSILYTCLLVATLLEFASGRYLMDNFPVNLTCLSRVPVTFRTHDSFRCTWLPPFNDSMGNCSLYFRATDEIKERYCTSVAEWNLCKNVLQDGPVCKVTPNHCPFEYISVMLHCEDRVRNSTSSEFSALDIVIPNPPSRIRLVATFKGRMNLSWKWPSGWDDDLHDLQLKVKYWQEVGGKQLGIKEDLIWSPTRDILPWDLSHLEYSYVKTCVQMSSIYKRQSSIWSAVACNRTQMERPTGKPEKITVRTLDRDEERGTRRVNVSWTPIPEIEQGGPNLYYEVKIYSLERPAVYNVSECFYVFNELNATEVYNIQVTVCNVVGRSTTHATYVLDKLENPIKVSATSRYGMIIGVILFVTVIIIVIISSLLVLKRKLNSGNEIEWKLNVKVPDKSDLSQGNVFETEREVFDKLWEKKEFNNNENIQSRDGIEAKSFQEKEEYQPFIVVKNDWTTSSHCRNLQAVGKGYVDAGGKFTSSGKRDADLDSEHVSDGNVAVDLKSEYVTDGNVAAVLKSEYVSDGKVAGDLKSDYVSGGKVAVDLKSDYVSDDKVAADLKSEYVSDSNVAVDLKSEYVTDGNVAAVLKSEYVSDGKVAGDLKSDYVSDGKVAGDFKSEYVSDSKVAVDLKSEYVCDGNVAVDVKPEDVSDSNVAVDLKSEYVSVGKIAVDLKSQYVSDGNMSVDLKSEYVSDDKLAVDLKCVDGNSSCKHVAGDLEQPYIQL